MKLLAVYTTVATQDQARDIARTLVERKLAACAQICPIESFYRWNGTLQHEPEVRVLLKTTEARYPEVEAALREVHPYELPAIHAVVFDAVSAPYAAWVEQESAGT